MADFTISAEAPIQLAQLKIASAKPLRRSTRKRTRPKPFQSGQVAKTYTIRRVARRLPNLTGKPLPLPKAQRISNTRPDFVSLTQHIEDIQKHYERYNEALKRSQRLGKKARGQGKLELERKHRKLAKAAKGKLTEAIGEMNATNKILKEQNDWTLLHGFAPGPGIDQIWQGPNGELHVVEAKGPGATLGSSDRKGGQMSRKWVLESARGMADDHGIVNALESPYSGGTRGVPKVRGYVISSTPSGKKAQKHWQTFDYN